LPQCKAAITYRSGFSPLSKKYLCAIGGFCAGLQSSSSPSAVIIFGVAPLWVKPLRIAQVFPATSCQAARGIAAARAARRAGRKRLRKPLVPSRVLGRIGPPPSSAFGTAPLRSAPSGDCAGPTRRFAAMALLRGPGRKAGPVSKDHGGQRA